MRELEVIDGAHAFDGYRSLIDERLRHLIESDDSLPSELRAALLHSIIAGGKRIRPTVALLACESVGGSLEAALGPSLAVELLHTATLVYDDIIDGDTTRRGAPSVHIAFGEDLAIVTAGVLSTLALRMVEGNSRLVSMFINAMHDLGVGEVLDIRGDVSDIQGCLLLAEKKTATLFKLAAEVGAALGKGAPKHRRALGSFGLNLGIAFQLRDDVLGVVGDPAQLGKPIWSDIRNGSPSVIRLLLSERGVPAKSLLSVGSPKGLNLTMQAQISDAVTSAMSICEHHAKRAEEALRSLPANSYTSELRALLELSVNRSS
jgi:geranylgeranyl diphosphate synthase, type I